jgi:methyl-accepting chemotaxis protein
MFRAGRSVVTRLHLLVAMLALAALLVAGAGQYGMWHQAGDLEEVSEAAEAARLAERANAAVLAAVMESRGMYMARDAAELQRFATPLAAALEQLRRELAAWARLVVAEDRSDFERLQAAAAEFIAFRTEMMQAGLREGAAAADRIGNNEANRANRRALNAALERAAGAASRRAVELRESAVEDTRLITLTILGLTLAVVAALVTAALLVLRRAVLRPFAALDGAATAMAGGALDQAVPCTDRGDEFGRLAVSLENFRTATLAARRAEAERHAEMDRRLAEAQRVQRRVADFEAEAAGRLGTVAAASRALTEAAGSLGRLAMRAREQSADVAGATQEASSATTAVAAATEELSSSVVEVTRQVGAAAQAANRAAGDVQRTDAAVAELSAATARIGEVVGLIGNIAGQTNLLALNATIEAARAGEAGKGFAVVAGEVKSLASQAARATQEIEQQIAAIRATAEGVVGAIQGIGASMSTMQEMTQAVAAAAEQQTVATQEITRSAAETAAGTGRIAGTIGEVAAGAAETEAAGERLSGVAETLLRETEALRGGVDRFLQELRAA